MSGFIVFIVIAVAWAVLGSLKAAADRVGSPDRPNTAQALARRNTIPTPEKPKERSVGKQRPAYRSNLSVLKIEDSLPDFGDTVEIEKPLKPSFKISSPLQEPVKNKKRMDLGSLLKGDRLAESIILAECLDRPRAHRPHPLAGQHNVPKRRG